MHIAGLGKVQRHMLASQSGPRWNHIAQSLSQATDIDVHYRLMVASTA